MSNRRVMLPLVYVLLTTLHLSSGCKTGLTSCISSALDRIQTSQRYDLVPGLFFQRSHNTTEYLPQKGSLITRAERVFKTHDLHWNALPGVDFKVINGKDGFSLKVDSHNQELEDSSRTFGFRRRMKMMMLPIMFKLGVITTLLTLLTVFSLKGLTIGVLLLALAIGSLLSKFKFHHNHSSGWDQGWEPPHKEVHLHVHPYMTGHGHWQKMDQPYYDPSHYPVPAQHYMPQYPSSRRSKELLVS